MQKHRPSPTTEEKNVVADDTGTIAVLVATQSKPLASQIERNAKYGGLAPVTVEPTSDAIMARVGETESCVVVLDALQNEADVLAIVKILSVSRPKAKAVILGRSPDLALVARGIVAGASHFLLESTPADEFGKALADLVVGKTPNDESLFGRVSGSLPDSESREGWFRTPAGRRLSVEDAIKQCDQFGLSVDEIADYLHVPIGDAERITKKSRKVAKPSLLSHILESLMAVGGGNVDSRNLLLAVLALLLAVRVAVLGISPGSSGVPTALIRGRLVSRLSAESLRGLHICFWPVSADGKQAGKVRPSTVRVWSEDGRFDGKVIVDTHHSDAVAKREYAVTIRNGEYSAFPEKILPEVYGDPARTPLRVKSLGGEVVVTLPER
jgi:DNA-binding NarL/FixJ family response regulator